MKTQVPVKVCENLTHWLKFLQATLLFWHLLTSAGTAKQAKRGGLKPVSILEKPFSNGEMQLRRLDEVGFRARCSAVGGVTQGNRQRGRRICVEMFISPSPSETSAIKCDYI